MIRNTGNEVNPIPRFENRAREERERLEAEEARKEHERFETDPEYRAAMIRQFGQGPGYRL